MHALLVIGIVLIVGTFVGNLAAYIRLPRISGYLIAGILMSPAVTGWVSHDLVTDKLTPLVDMGLALIVFTIGGSLRFKQIRLRGYDIVMVSVFGALASFGLTAVIFITLVPWAYHVKGLELSIAKTYLPAALLLGAIACATAPGAVLAIVREVRARGPLTTTLMGVVALDNMLAILLFGFASVTSAFLTATNPNTLHLGKFLGYHLLKLFGSIAIGAVGGALLPLAIREIRRMEILFVVVTGFVLGCAGLATTLGLSLPLACLTLGFVTVNLSVKEEAVLDVFLPVDELVFTLFFAVAGMHLDVSVLLAAGIWMPFILVGWFGGKLVGTRVGGLLSKAPSKVTRFIGWALTPKAGVAMGLVLTVGHYLSDPLLAEVLINAVLGSIIINEIVAPPLVKRAMVKAGEGKADRVRRRRRPTVKKREFKT
jgi:Kef-type K+ transport system membrane component KefB